MVEQWNNQHLWNKKHLSIHFLPKPCLVEKNLVSSSEQVILRRLKLVTFLLSRPWNMLSFYNTLLLYHSLTHTLSLSFSHAHINTLFHSLPLFFLTNTHTFSFTLTGSCLSHSHTHTLVSFFLCPIHFLFPYRSSVCLEEEELSKKDFCHFISNYHFSFRMVIKCPLDYLRDHLSFCLIKWVLFFMLLWVDIS